MTDITDPRRKQLLYRAQHRGIKEADLLIGGFAAANLNDMTEDELREFEALLVLPDQDLYDWATGAKPAPDKVKGPLFDKICAFDVVKYVQS